MKSLTKKVITTAIFSSIISSVTAQEVELVSSWNMDMSYLGMSWKDDAFTVIVEDLGNNKQVFIHHQKNDGSWVDLPMSYYGPSAAGKEIWTSTPGYEEGNSFAVKYQVNGQTYWDDNQGQNYIYPNGGYHLVGDRQVLVTTYNTNSSNSSGDKYLLGRIALKNLGYNKTVKIVYSQDNWQSSSTIYALYGGNPFSYGYGSHPNPNSFNTETWVFNQYISPKRGEFFVEYDVNGEQYYDNNDGLNYTLNPNANYSSMYLRSSPSWGNGMPMSLIQDHTWVTNFSVGQTPIEFKFDAYNNWAINYGDNETDGIVEENGNNIVINSNGNYRIVFNDQSLSYTIQKLDALQ